MQNNPQNSFTSSSISYLFQGNINAWESLIDRKSFDGEKIHEILKKHKTIALDIQRQIKSQKDSIKVDIKKIALPAVEYLAENEYLGADGTLTVKGRTFFKNLEIQLKDGVK